MDVSPTAALVVYLSLGIGAGAMFVVIVYIGSLLARGLKWLCSRADPVQPYMPRTVDVLVAENKRFKEAAEKLRALLAAEDEKFRLALGLPEHHTITFVAAIEALKAEKYKVVGDHVQTLRTLHRVQEAYNALVKGNPVSADKPDLVIVNEDKHCPQCGTERVCPQCVPQSAAAINMLRGRLTVVEAGWNSEENRLYWLKHLRDPLDPLMEPKLSRPNCLLVELTSLMEEQALKDALVPPSIPPT